MDTGLLKAFLEVNKLRHFGRAAQNLFISQSAISARIKQLEEEVGTRLFTRDRNNIELTPAGVRFLAYAENILNTWQRARQEVSIPDSSSSFLSIAAQPSLWDIFMDDWLVWLNRTRPGIALHTNVLDSNQLNQDLINGVLDLGFVLDPPGTSQLSVREVLAVPLVMVSTEQGQSLESALAQHYIYVDWGTSFSMLHARYFADSPPPSMRAAVGRIAMNFLLQCGGAAYLPRPVIETMLGQQLFEVENAPVIPRQAYVVFSPLNNKLDVIEEALGWFDHQPTSPKIE